MNGGGDVAQYYLSASHNNDTGLLKVNSPNNFNNNIDINLSKSELILISTQLELITQIMVKFNSFEDIIALLTMLFLEWSQTSPVNFPKFYFDEISTKFNHTLFGNKGNGGFVNPCA